MNKHITTILTIALLTLGLAFTIRPSADEAVPYPDGYRKWTHIKTGLIGPTSPSFQTSGGFHHIYANEKAMEGYTTGNFPEGSVLVFDVLEALEKNGNTAEGKRRHVDVMIKDSIKYPSTGGWGFEEFKGDSKTERALTETVRAQCSKCHASQKDYIFSALRD